MSTLRLLISDLAARPDSSLLRLLSLRPELMDPAAADFAALATRASSRAGLARALDLLNQPQLQVLTSLIVMADPDSGATAARIASAVAGATVEQVAPLLDQLHELALVLHAPLDPPDTDDAGPRLFLAVTSLREVLGAHPAGLGRNYVELAEALPGCRDRLAGIVARMGHGHGSVPGRAAPPAGNPPDGELARQRTDGGPDATGQQAGPAPEVPGQQAGPAPSVPGQRTDPAAEMQRFLASFTGPELLLEGAPEGTSELLAKFESGPMGRVGHALRDLSPASAPGGGEGVSSAAASQNAARHNPGGAVEWLLRRGLLIPLDDDHVELPREVGLLLRHGSVITSFAPESPSRPAAHIRATLRDNASMGAVASVLRTMARLLDSVEDAPLATLRAGGVGVRSVRTLARDLDVEMAQSYFYLELAAMAKLISLDPDTSQWRATASAWRSRDRAEQWLWLTSAWLDAGRMPSLVGSGSPAVNVLAGEANRADAPALRNTSLQVLAALHLSLTQGAVPATVAAGSSQEGTGQAIAGQDGAGVSGADQAAAILASMVPAPTIGQVLEHYAWHHPRPARRVANALAGFLAEAEILGLTGAAALTDLGLAVIDRDWDAALALLTGALPEPVEHVLLQGDLTAVAPGFLSPALSAELSLLAEPEGSGTAGVFRFTPASIQRALAAGRTASGILNFLATHSVTPVPQPLEYLVQDAAARHGRFTVGAASAFISTENPELLAELLAGDMDAHLGLTAISPTVAVSTLTSAELARGMLDAGHSPALADSDSTPEPNEVVGGTRRAALPAKHEAVAPYETARLLAAEETGPEETGTDETRRGNAVGLPLGLAAAQLNLLRSRPAWSPGLGESAPALVREQLQRAIRAGTDVWLTTVRSDGGPERLRLHPVTVMEGRVRAFDPDRASERIFSIHRVMEVELIDGSGKKGTP
ncbi:hypothetical protein CVV68_03935 [Arthrobacter livingstonensis]|uniref:Helicase XPB/Ssl2 N-terminal domain-containing protein n=1 Tax=Arthrobacter livingstonensis TaxID=670078 RepID=A0A2V5LGC2_9MICC|nr:helicase-associated domain-containing protein [Arthrobacter livingstonensis]PYI68963.1 hypothetical protein CVV68_03935 [Arthrobacter livingstonensis]